MAKERRSTNIIIILNNIKFHQTYRVEVETPASKQQHAMNFLYYFSTNDTTILTYMSLSPHIINNIARKS